MLIKQSTEYFRALFNTVLTIVEKEFAFTKLEPLMRLQKRNGLSFGTTDKLNYDACAEMVDTMHDVVVDYLKGFMLKAKFCSLSGDASEARKTSEEKELVFTRVVVNGLKGYVPCMFLLRYQSLKEFGGGSGEGTFQAMLDAALKYSSEESIKKMLLCVVADGASVNFGVREGALTKMAEFVEWDLVKIHCMNHRLELAIKDSFIQRDDFVMIKDMLGVLFRLFRNSGKCWRIFQVIGERLEVKVLRFLRCGGTRFQAHTEAALKNFIRNFLLATIFAENVEENGIGKDRIVTKEMFPRIVGFRKKWASYRFIAATNLYLQVLNETSSISKLMESDNTVIYEVLDAVKESCQNLQSIANSLDDYEYLPFNIKESAEHDITETVSVQITAANTTLEKWKEIDSLPVKQREEAKVKIKKFTENFVLTDVASRKEAVDSIRQNLLPKICDNISARFQSFVEDDFYEAFKLFDVRIWPLDDDTHEIKKADEDKIDIIHARIKQLLDGWNFSAKDAKKEWIKAKRVAKSRYMSLHKRQAVLWSRFLTSKAHEFPNVTILLEMLLVILPSSSVVERGFSTLRRNLRENRLSMSNRRLNALLVIKSNLPTLREVIENFDKELVEACIKKYNGGKNWHWAPRFNNEPEPARPESAESDVTYETDDSDISEF